MDSTAYLSGVEAGTQDFHAGADFAPADLGASFRDGYADGWQVASAR
jgi:hypothetical protein